MNNKIMVLSVIAVIIVGLFSCTGPKQITEASAETTTVPSSALTSVAETSETAETTLQTLKETESTITSETVSETVRETVKETVKETETASETIQEKNYEEAKCVSVIDGDTIKIKDSAGNIYKVRYIGIDTPEKGQPFYQEAKKANESLVLNKTVRLEKDVSETDKYGRLLRYVYVDDLFVNAFLVAEGFAVILTIPPDVKHSEYFLGLQKEARQAGKGLWGIEVAETTAVAPATETTQAETTQTSGKFVGSKKSDVYHYPDCQWAKKIKPENLITFNSVEEAKAKGYRPCKVCNPPG